VWRRGGGEDRSAQFPAGQTSGELRLAEDVKRAYAATTLVAVNSLVSPDLMIKIRAITVTAA
jgi:hypothetical protein